MIFNKKYISSFQGTNLALGTKAKLFDPSFSTDSELIVYNIRTKEKSSLKMASRFNRLLWAGNLIICGLENGEIAVACYEDNSISLVYSNDRLLSGDVRAIAFSQQKQIFAAGSENGKIVLWNVQNLQKPYSTGIKTTIGDIYSLAFNQHVTHILAVGTATDLVILDLRQKKEVVRLTTGIRTPVRALAWHPLHKTALIVGTDDQLFISDLSSDHIQILSSGVIDFSICGTQLFSFTRNLITWIDLESNEVKKADIEGLCDFRIDSNLSLAVASYLSGETKISPLSSIFSIFPAFLKKQNPIKFLNSVLITSKDSYKVSISPVISEELPDFNDLSTYQSDELNADDPVIKYLLTHEIGEKEIIAQNLQVPASFFLRSESLAEILKSVDPVTRLLLSLEVNNFHHLKTTDWPLVLQILQKQKREIDDFVEVLDPENQKICYYVTGKYDKYLKIREEELKKPKSISEYLKYLKKVSSIVDEQKKFLGEKKIFVGSEEFFEFNEFASPKNYRFKENSTLRSESNVLTRDAGKKEDFHLQSNIPSKPFAESKPLFPHTSPSFNSQNHQPIGAGISNQPSRPQPAIPNPISNNVKTNSTAIPNPVLNNNPINIPPPRSYPTSSPIIPSRPDPNSNNPMKIISPITPPMPCPTKNPTNVNNPAINQSNPAAVTIKPTVQDQGSKETKQKKTYGDLLNINHQQRISSGTTPQRTPIGNLFPSHQNSKNSSNQKSESPLIIPQPFSQQKYSPVFNPTPSKPTTSNPNTSYANTNITKDESNRYPEMNNNSNRYTGSSPFINPDSKTTTNSNSMNERDKVINSQSQESLIKEVVDSLEKIKSIAVSKKGIIFKSRINEAIQRLKHFDKKIHNNNFDSRFLKELISILQTDFDTREQKQAHLEISRKTIFRLNEIYGKQDDIEIWLPGIMMLLQIALSD